jgi:hypothetical protein
MSGSIWGDDQQDTAPAGFGGYAPAVMDEETRRRLMMQVGLPAMGAQFGAALLAASQRGLTPGQRAFYMAQAGQAPAAGFQAVGQAEDRMQRGDAQRMQAQLMGLQGRDLQARIAEREGQNAYWRGDGGGARAPAATLTGAPAGEGGFTPGGLQRLFGAESGGDPNARAPTSSAGGLGQFTNGTWLAFARENPQHFQGMDQNQILAARFGDSGRALMPQATQWYARRNAGPLQQAGVPVNDATLALAHQFDGPVAARMILAAQQNPTAPVEQIVGPAAVAANQQQLAGKTVGDVVGTFARRYGAGGQPNDATPVVPAGASQGVQMLVGLGLPPDMAEMVARLPPEQRAQVQAQLIQQRGQQRNAQIVGDAQRGFYQVVQGPDGQAVLRPLGGGPQQGEVSQETQGREASLRGEFRQATSGFDDRQQAFQSLRTMTTSGGAYNDIAAIFALFKIIDPTSTVREGEFATAQNAASIPDRIRNLWNRAQSGERMTEQQRRELMGVAGTYFDNAATSYERELNRFRELATQYGGSPDRIARDARDPAILAERQQHRVNVERVRMLRERFPNNLTARIEVARQAGIPLEMVQ